MTEQFLKILDLERLRALRLLAAASLLGLLALAMAELADPPRLGWESRLYLGMVVSGALLGFALSRRRTRRQEESLRNGWNAWMRMSVSSATLDEVDRKVRDAPPRSGAATGIVAGVLLVGNAALFAALWNRWESAAVLALGVCASNGLLVGALLARAMWTLGWTRSFARALHELLAQGGVGLRGER